MKRMVLRIAIILCIVLTLPSFAYADAITRAESLCCALAFDMDGTPVAAIVLSELCTEDIMSDGLESLLSRKSSGDVTTDGAVCCVPNPPTRQIVVYYHIPSSNSKQCKGSKENWWQCTKCWAVIRKSATIQLGYHTKGDKATGCPY